MRGELPDTVALHTLIIMWLNINTAFYTLLLSVKDGDILLLPGRHFPLLNIQDGG